MLSLMRVCDENSNKKIPTAWEKYVYLHTAPVAQLDECPTGDQEVPGSIPMRSKNIVSWSLPSTNSRRLVVIFWQKNVHK